MSIMREGLHWIDGVIVAAYAAGMLSVGWYYSRRQTSAEEYFVGNRVMNPLLIGVSIFATLFSTISYLSVPGELINNGPVVLTSTITIPISYYVVGYWIIPVYMKFRATSAYELLEAQLGLAARLMGASLFVFLRLAWMSLLIFFASEAILVMLGLDRQWLSIVTFATGSVAIFYSSLGGLRAVVITDLFQFLLLFGGGILVIVTVSVQLQGFGWLPTEWNPEWDTQPLFSLDPAVRVTVFGSVVSGVLWWVITAGSDQTAIQRFMATRDSRAARRSFLVNSLAGLSVQILLALVAFSLLGYFQSSATVLPSGMTIDKNADYLFPHYIAYRLPIGLSGLVVSGLFAAAMSSIDSGINSITAVVMTDFVDRFRKRSLTEASRLRAARLIAIGTGLFVVSVSSYMQYVPGNFLAMTNRTLGLFAPPIFTLFFLALFVRFTTQIGAIVGACFGLLAAILIAYWQPLTGSPMSFQWISPVSLLVGITVGCVVSILVQYGRSN